MINIGLVKLPSQESPKVGRQEANFAIYFANFTLTNENNISSTQTGTKLLYKYKHFFFIENGNLIINWISYKHTVPERLSFQSDKYEIKGTLKKKSIYHLFSKLFPPLLCRPLLYELVSHMSAAFFF